MSDESPTSSPDVSVVIVSWNVHDFLRDCVRSVVDQTRRSHEIIVIDNASADASTEMIEAEFPTVRLIANQDNRGFAAANNQGLAVAISRCVLLLNPDTLVLDGAIDSMLDWLDRHPDVGCVGCQVFETDTDVQMTCFRDPGPLNLFLIEAGLRRAFAGSRFFGRPHYGGWDRTDERDVDVVSGMFMLVPRGVVEEVGVMDDAFFIYSEEADGYATRGTAASSLWSPVSCTATGAGRAPPRPCPGCTYSFRRASSSMSTSTTGSPVVPSPGPRCCSP